MIKIRAFFTDRFEMVKELLSKYPVTLGIIGITTLFMAIFGINESISSEIYYKILLFLTIMMVGDFFVETTLNKDMFKVIGFTISAGVSYLFVNFFYNNNGSREEECAIYALIGYILILILLAMYKILKNSNHNFQEYALTLFTGIFKNTIVYLILALGVSLIAATICALFLENEYIGEIMYRLNILVLGLYFVPALLNSVTKFNDKEISTFIKAVIKYVLFGLVFAAFLIIYAYIIKIFVTREIPSNVIFRIISGLFIAAFPVWNMVEALKSNKTILNCTKIMQYGFIPFILLEVYSIGIRVVYYGLTPLRYIAIAFLLVQIICLLFVFIKNKKYLSEVFLYVSGVILVVSMILNPANASIKYQKYILDKYMCEGQKFEELKDNEKEKVYSAYDYLINCGEKDAINRNVVNSEEEIQNYHNRKYEYERRNYRSIEVHGKIDVRGYSYIKEAYGDNYGTGAAEIIYIEGNKVDISKVLLKMNENYDEKNNNFNGEIIKIEEDKVFYITEISWIYDEVKNQNSEVYVNGFLMEK